MAYVPDPTAAAAPGIAAVWRALLTTPPWRDTEEPPSPVADTRMLQNVVGGRGQPRKRSAQLREFDGSGILSAGCAEREFVSLGERCECGRPAAGLVVRSRRPGSRTTRASYASR